MHYFSTAWEVRADTSPFTTGSFCGTTYKVGPPSYVCWFTNPMNTIVISTINHSEMGVMFTNLAIDQGPHIVLHFREFTMARFFRGVEVGHQIRELPGPRHDLGMARLAAWWCVLNHQCFMGMSIYYVYIYMVTIWQLYDSGLWMFMVDIPSGYVKIAIKNGHRNSGFTH